MIDYIDMADSMARELKTLGKALENTNVEDSPEAYGVW